MVKTNNARNVNINTPNVNVHDVSNNGVPSNRSTRNRRKRNKKAMPITNPGGDKLVNTSGVMLSEMQDMNSGRMTNDSPMSDLSFLRGLRSGTCEMDTNTAGWYFKYLDPAGAVETGRAMGEFSKIPDGLFTHSVDAEIRTVDQLHAPNVLVSNLPLTGDTWSLTIFSYPMFRTAYIAIANILDKEISPFIAAELAYALNNLTDYRETIDMDNWSPFAETIEEGWFYWIKPLPPTYNLPDPQDGNVRTLTSWRMSYKSLTVEHNAPTLIDQGFWNGGNYALDGSIVQQPTRGARDIPSTIHGTSISVDTPALSPGLFRFIMRIPNMPQITSIVGPGEIVSGHSSFYIRSTGDNTITPGAPIVFTVPPGTTLYNPFEVVFAEPGDTVSILTSTSGTNIVVTLTSSFAGTPVPIVLTFIGTPVTGTVFTGSQALTDIFIDEPINLFEGRTSNQIEFPAYSPAQVAANNPKMEQFLMKETNGAYAVHKKMRKPVFEVTPASSFGPIQFTTPGYDLTRNAEDGSGILDTIDANFSTVSICIRGIAHANVPIVKLYFGWEGITNLNTPFGQFGHSGLPRNDTVLQMVDNLTVLTTGVYPANDNFLGLIAKLASGALRSLLSSDATPALLGKLAQSVINQGVGSARRRMGQPRKSAVANYA